MIDWDGSIPRRRYALFRERSQLIMLVVTDDDIERAAHWNNFVTWVGQERPSEYRNVKAAKYKSNTRR